MATTSVAFTWVSTTANAYPCCYKGGTSQGQTPFYFYTAKFTLSVPLSSLDLTLDASATTSQYWGSGNFRNPYFHCAIYPKDKSFTPTWTTSVGKQIGWTYNVTSSSPADLTFSTDTDGNMFVPGEYRLYVWFYGSQGVISCSGNITPKNGEGTIAGLVRIYDGSAWKQAIPYVYDGSSWKQCIPYIYNGSAWKVGT